MSDTDNELYYLDELPDYKVASDDCDVRGWTVADATGRTLGRVDNLLVSKAAERVVYLDVEVDKDVIAHGQSTPAPARTDGMYAFLNKDGDDHLIIPVGLVELDEEAERVLTPQIQFNTFASAGRLAKGKIIDRGYEIYLRRHFVGETTGDKATGMRDSFYSGRTFEHRLKRQKR